MLKLDKLVSQIVNKRDEKCVTCGSIEQPTCGHLFSRSHYSTRWDLMNCFKQCWPCNFKHEFDWKPFNDWFENKFGKEAMLELYNKWKTVKKWKTYELQELYEELKVTYENL